MTDVTFYFDLGSPYAYLASERLATIIDQPVSWQPVLLGGLFKLTGRSSWALGDYGRRRAGMAEIERRARGCGLPSFRWPDPRAPDLPPARSIVRSPIRGSRQCSAARPMQPLRGRVRRADARGWRRTVLGR